MAIYREFRVGNNGGPFGFLLPLLMLSAVIFIFYLFFKGLYYVLNYVTPVLLVLTLLIDWKVIWHFLIYLWQSLRQQPFFGVVLVALTVVAYPFVSGYLFFKAVLNLIIRRKLKQMQQNANRFDSFTEVPQEEGFTEYVEIDESASHIDKK